LSLLSRSPAGLLRASYWSLVGTVAAQVALLAGNALAARLLGAERYGGYSLTLTSANMLTTLAAAGVVVVTTRGVASRRSRASAPDAISYVRYCLLVALLLSVAFGLVLCVCGDWFSVRILHDARGSDYFWAAMALSLPLTASQIQYGALAGLEGFRASARVRAFTGTLGAAMLVVTSLLRSVLLVIFGAVIAAVTSWWVGAREFRRLLRRDAATPHENAAGNVSGQERSVDRFGRRDLRLLFPAIATGLFSTPIIWLCQTISSGGAGGLGAFAALTVMVMWSQAILLVPSNIGQPLLPAMMNAFDPKSASDGPWKLFVISIGLIAVSVLPVCALLAAFSAPILSLYGRQFSQYATSFDVLIIATGLQALSVPALVVIQALGKLWIHFASNVIWACLFIGLTVAFEAKGIPGYANACLASFSVHATLVNCWAIARLRFR
jgi:O-antigen/teichoic acid export membrane protein